MSYAVNTPVFEGPFDLLLHLILRDQVELYEISLSAIVDEYLAEISRMEQLDLGVATEFLLIAATLVEMKARRLMPGEDDADLDDELALWEERDLLLARLLECKTFKDAGALLDRLASRAALNFPRRVGPTDEFSGLLPDLMDGVTPDRLANAFVKAMTPTPRPAVDLSHVAPIRVSVVDIVADVSHQLRSAGRMQFRQLTAHVRDRIELAVYFLAILELYKQGHIDVAQARSFGDIDVRWTGSDDDVSTVFETVDSYDG